MFVVLSIQAMLSIGARRDYHLFASLMDYIDKRIFLVCSLWYYPGRQVWLLASGESRLSGISLLPSRMLRRLTFPAILLYPEIDSRLHTAWLVRIGSVRVFVIAAPTDDCLGQLSLEILFMPPQHDVLYHYPTAASLRRASVKILTLSSVAPSSQECIEIGLIFGRAGQFAQSPVVEGIVAKV